MGSPPRKVDRSKRGRVPEEVVLQPKTRAEWRAWLTENWALPKGIWVILVKKGSRLKGLDYEAAVEEALCFGWIDTQPHSLDEGHFRLHLTPRRRGSVWSKNNKDRVRRLSRQGLMAAPGLAKVRAAKKDGSWELVDAIDRLEIPPDLKQALAQDRAAKDNFERSSISSRKMILYWIASARLPETRRKRIEAAVRQAANNDLASLLRPKAR